MDKIGAIKQSESLCGELKFYLRISFILTQGGNEGIDFGGLLIYTKTVNYIFSRPSLLMKIQQ